MTLIRTGDTPSDAPVVETVNGRLRGSVVDGTDVFKGVRYAASTAGSNRFLPAQKVENWAGIQDALSWGASAPQSAVLENTDPFYAWYAAIQPISEDCLFLNIFTPATDSGNRPVLFWIHGGGWREFSGTAPGFDGTVLAAAQDVVVVTINHRLNGFGFLKLADSDERFADSGNAGLLDIVAALRWVRDNIARFGGDAGNVTIFGESGGASKIAAILAIRAAQGLFHKAILQSSAGGMRLADPAAADRAAAGLARVLDMPRLDGGALQKLPMQTLVDAFSAAGGPFRGMIDGRSFDADPFGDSAPTIAAGIPLLAGCTNTETIYHLRMDPAFFQRGEAVIERRLTRFFGITPEQTGRLIAGYRAAYPQEDAQGIMVMITSDFIFKRNTYRMAALQSVSARVPVYAYLFDRNSPVDGGRVRSAHTGEVPFIFGTAVAAAAHVGTGDDIAPMTQRMMAVWAAFARTGNPNCQEVPDWAPFRADDRQTMILDTTCRLVRDPGSEARAAFESMPWFDYGYPLSALWCD